MCFLELLVKTSNVRLIILPLTCFLGLTQHSLIVGLELVQFVLCPVQVLFNNPLQALCPYPIPVVIDSIPTGGMDGRILKDKRDCQISMSDFIAQLNPKQTMRIHRQAILKRMYCTKSGDYICVSISERCTTEWSHAKSGDSIRVHFPAMRKGIVSR